MELSYNIRENHRIADVTPGALRSILRKWCNTAILIIVVMLVVSTLPALASALTCDCEDICINETGWWRDGGVFNANTTTSIQAASDDATALVKDINLNEVGSNFYDLVAINSTLYFRVYDGTNGS